jgi:hypothetical protein
VTINYDNKADLGHMLTFYSWYLSNLKRFNYLVAYGYAIHMEASHLQRMTITDFGILGVLVHN